MMQAVPTTCPVEQVSQGAPVLEENPQPEDVPPDLKAELDHPWYRIRLTTRLPDGSLVETELLRLETRLLEHRCRPGLLLRSVLPETNLTALSRIHAIEPMAVRSRGEVACRRPLRMPPRNDKALGSPSRRGLCCFSFSPASQRMLSVSGSGHRKIMLPRLVAARGPFSPRWAWVMIGNGHPPGSFGNGSGKSRSVVFHQANHLGSEPRCPVFPGLPEWRCPKLLPD